MDNEIFNQIASDYRDIHKANLKSVGGDSEYYAEYKIKELATKLENHKAIKILDLGCGDGLSSIYFQTYFTESAYFGVDISSESIKEATKKRVGNFQVYDGYSLPFSENEFDLLFVSCVLHHIALEDRPIVFQEIKRVLKPGGILAIFEHNPFNPITQRIVSTCVFDKDAILLKPASLKKQLKKIGFSNTKIIYTLFFPRWKIFQPFYKLERFFTKIPLGGQYYVTCSK